MGLLVGLLVWPWLESLWHCFLDDDLGAKCPIQGPVFPADPGSPCLVDPDLMGKGVFSAIIGYGPELQGCRGRSRNTAIFVVGNI